jgi:hypothetical protein
VVWCATAGATDLDVQFRGRRFAVGQLHGDEATYAPLIKPSGKPAEKFEGSFGQNSGAYGSGAEPIVEPSAGAFDMP